MKFNPGSFPLIHVESTTVQNGRACVKLKLPDWPANEGEKTTFILYLWDEKGALAFQARRPVMEEEPCIIQLLHPHLWEGANKPYLYRLELYVEIKKSGSADDELLVQFLEERWLPVRTLCEIPGKGLYLNRRAFLPACIRVALPDEASDRQKFFSKEFLETRLISLIQMGANILCMDEDWELSESERVLLQESCDKCGLILEDCEKLRLQENDTNVNMNLLFDGRNHPTESYYKYKAMWSKEPFVYISVAGLCRQPDGGYSVCVYSNRKKVVLLMNGVVFAFQEDGPEFLFQDIQIKAFPVWLSAEGEGCSMSVVYYEG